MYLRPKEIMKELSISRTFIYNLCNEMEASGDYPRAIISKRNLKLIDKDSLIDWMLRRRNETK